MSRQRHAVIRTLAFGLLLVLALLLANHILRYKWERKEAVGMKKDQIMAMPEASVDVVLMGASAVYTAFLPPVLYDTHGIRSFNLGTSVQPPLSYYYNMAEICERHDPKVVVVDFPALKRASDPTDEAREPYYLKAYASLKDPKLKFRFVNELHDRYPDVDRLSYFIPLYRYHDRWKELTKADFALKSPYEPGLLGARLSLKQVPIPWRNDYMKEENVAPIEPAEASVEDYQKMIDFCRAHDMRILSVLPPREAMTVADRDLAKHYAEAHDLLFLDLNEEAVWETTGLDPDTDFYDAGHVNLSGAEKLTRYLGDYLVGELGLRTEPHAEGDAYYREMVDAYDALPKALTAE